MSLEEANATLEKSITRLGDLVEKLIAAGGLGGGAAAPAKTTGKKADPAPAPAATPTPTPKIGLDEIKALAVQLLAKTGNGLAGQAICREVCGLPLVGECPENMYPALYAAFEIALAKKDEPDPNAV